MSSIDSRNTQLTIAYDKYADMLYHLSLSHMQNREDAEDVVQEVFTKYFCGLHLPMNLEQEKAWFIRVAINQCHDALRKKGYRTHASLDEVAEMAAKEETELGHIQDALQKVPEKNMIFLQNS